MDANIENRPLDAGSNTFSEESFAGYIQAFGDIFFVPCHSYAFYEQPIWIEAPENVQ